MDQILSARRKIAFQSFLAFCLISTAGFIFLMYVGVGALDGINSFQFFADSNTYYEGAMDFLSGKNLKLLVSINNN